MIPFTSAVGVFTGTSRARFGSSIVSLGDLDYDGYNGKERNDRGLSSFDR